MVAGGRQQRGSAPHEAPIYSFAAAAKILEIAESKLRYWSQVGIVGPSLQRGGRQAYSFADLVGAKAARELYIRGVKPAQMQRALSKVRDKLPHLDRPLEHLRIAFDGDSLLVLDDGAAFELTGQRVFNFSVAELVERVTQVSDAARREAAPATYVAPVVLSSLHAPASEGDIASPAAEAEPASRSERSAYEWFVEGTRLDGEPGRADEAAACYRQALAADSGLAAAHTNLGNLAYRRGDMDDARLAFEAALALDPDQPEARFNLANLILEEGDLELAVAEYRRVLQGAPDFADAHFNLALALERLGGRAQARAHLERYLGLGADGPSPWAEEARALIARLS